MSRGTFAVGTPVWVHGRAARIVDSADWHAAHVEFLPSGERQCVDLLALYQASAIRWDAPVDSAPQARNLEQISEEEWAVARTREALIKPLCEGGDVDRRIAALATETGHGRRTLYRWKADYEDAGLRGLVPEYKTRGGAGRIRLVSQREALLQGVLKDVYLRRTRPTIAHTFEQVCATFIEEHLPPPCLHTVRARIAAIDATRRTAAREGGRKARARHAVSQGQFPAQQRPLQTIQIDHTPLDIQIVDSVDRTRVIGRPYLTVAIDCCTRMVFAYHLTLDPPCYLSVALCLLQGVLPKDGVVARFQLQQPWPIFGLPERVYVDNGKDFRSKYLEQFAAQYDIELVHRPVRQPWWGGQIERVIGTLNRKVHALPGTTRSSVSDRGDYDAEAAATFTLEEIEVFLARRIVEQYHCEVHSSLDKSPLQAWSEATGVGRFVPTLPSDVERFRIDVLPFEERTIQREGISLHDLTYSDGVLQTWRGTERRGESRRKYMIKYDPRDLSRVWFMPPEGGAPLAIPLLDRSVGVFSMLELDLAKAKAKAERQPLSMRALADMLRREREALAEAAAKTRNAKRAQRTAARVAQSRAAVGAPAEAVGALPTGPTTYPALPPPRHAEEPAEDDVLSDLGDADGWGTPVANWEREP